MTAKKPTPTTDPLKMWERASKQFKRMSSREQVQTLVDAGILTEKKNLRAPYRQVFSSKRPAHG